MAAAALLLGIVAVALGFRAMDALTPSPLSARPVVVNMRASWPQPTKSRPCSHVQASPVVMRLHRALCCRHVGRLLQSEHPCLSSSWAEWQLACQRRRRVGPQWHFALRGKTARPRSARRPALVSRRTPCAATHRLAPIPSPPLAPKGRQRQPPAASLDQGRCSYCPNEGAEPPHEAPTLFHHGISLDHATGRHATVRQTPRRRARAKLRAGRIGVCGRARARGSSTAQHRCSRVPTRPRPPRHAGFCPGAFWAWSRDGCQPGAKREKARNRG